MKYLLIEHGEGNAPATITICNSHVERLQVTRDAVLGPNNAGQSCPQIIALQEEGRATFLGDPPMDWIEGNVIITPSAEKTI